MGVCVNQAGDAGIVPQIDDFRACGRHRVRLDSFDSVVLHNHRRVGPHLALAIDQLTEPDVLSGGNRMARQQKQ